MIAIARLTCLTVAAIMVALVLIQYRREKYGLMLLDAVLAALLLWFYTESVIERIK